MANGTMIEGKSGAEGEVIREMVFDTYNNGNGAAATSKEYPINEKELPIVNNNNVINSAKFLITAERLANIILALGGVVCLLALMYFVYYYAWTRQRQFTSWAGVLLYYVTPALMTIVFFASLRLRASPKINLALLACSAGIGFYAVEVQLTLWFSLPSVRDNLASRERKQIAKTLGLEFDGRTKHQLVEDLLSRGVDAVPSIFPRGLLQKRSDGTLKSAIHLNSTEILPLGAPANKLIVVCNEGGRFLTYRSDEHGFNNPQTLWNHRSIDIVALGDSFAQGWCVAPDKSFVGLIRERYPATVNLGEQGNGPLIELASMREYGQILKPKTVLWFYFENDLQDLNRERHSPLLSSYLRKGFSQDLFSRQQEIDRVLIEYIKTSRDTNAVLMKLEEISALVRDPSQLSTGIDNIVRLGHLRQTLGLVQGQDRTPFSDAQPSSADNELTRSMAPLIELFNEILFEAKTSVERWGGRLYFVYLPGWHRYAAGQLGSPDRDAVMHVVAKLALPIIDVHQVFRAQKDPVSFFPLRVNGHYTEEGHRLVAQYVLQHIPSSSK